MNRSLLTGLIAAVSAVLLPLGLCGMTGQEAIPSPSPASAASAPAPSQSPVPSGRTIQAIVVHRSRTSEAADVSTDAQTVTVTVAGTPRDMTLSDYLTGVLMGEMPASYDPEALKAQAVAARTYTLHRLEGGGALSDDPAVCQAYIPPESAPEKLGDDWETLLEKLRSAVTETDSLVLRYEGALISATYFSGSGGRTESAQAVWGNPVPYLVSVASPGEEALGDYESTVTVPLSDFLSALDITDPGVSTVSYTPGGGVDTMVIGGKAVTGLTLRSTFGLRSTRFSMTVTEDAVLFDVLGYGHRVGLSQCGAQAMAVGGSTFDEILLWYYTGVTLEPY